MNEGFKLYWETLNSNSFMFASIAVAVIITVGKHSTGDWSIFSYFAYSFPIPITILIWGKTFKLKKERSKQNIVFLSQIA